jgi:hypothetical protein
MFRKVRNRTNSKFSVNSECLETPVFDPLTPVFASKQGFLTKNHEIIFKLISELFLQNFCEFKKTGYFRKISKLQKPNYSETRENKKFGKFRLLQGLSWKQYRRPT